MKFGQGNKTANPPFNYRKHKSERNIDYQKVKYPLLSFLMLFQFLSSQSREWLSFGIQSD